MRNKLLCTLVGCGCWFYLSTSVALENNNQSYQLLRDPAQVQVDGVLDEAVWQRATQIELNYENDPGEGIPAPVKTIAYLYEDGASLYIAFRAFDPQPSAIRANLRDRDDVVSDDNVGLIIDTFNDRRNGFGFFVNPLGAQSDMTIEDNNGLEDDDSWDAIWDSAGQITEQGYIVEMSIPFRALRFPESSEPLTWNIALYRNYPRSNWTQMSNSIEDRNLKCKICQFDSLTGFENTQPGNNFQLTPTLTLGRTDIKDTVNQTGWQQGEVENDVGLDLRWGINKNTVFNATLNPDFSQVEADSAQLDINNTFSLFYPEKRPFFLDGAEYFSTSNLNLVHTRNIGNPDFGAKITGKSNQHSYGLMLADDNATNFLIPGSQSDDIAITDLPSKIAIARYKMDVGERNNVGVLMTRRSADNYKNQLLSMDGNLWFDDTNSINYQIARAESTNPLQVQQDFGLQRRQAGNAYYLGYDHTTRNNNFYTEVQRVDQGFRADLGFVSQANFQRAEIGGGHTWFFDAENWLHEAILSASWDRSEDLAGNMLEQEWEVNTIIEGRMQFYGDYNALHRKRLYQGEYFNENQLSIWNEFFPVSGLLLASLVEFGTEVDVENAKLADKLRLDGYIQWQMNQHFNLFIYHNFTRLNNGQTEIISANLTDANLTWQFNIRSRLSLILQYTSIERNLAVYKMPEYFAEQERYLTSQLLYSYEINPQTLFYIGYADNGFQDASVPRLTKTDRTVFAKFSYAWQL